MYRQTMLGCALECTLSELTDKYELTSDQKDHIWRIFDKTMEESLKEAPIVSRVFVQQPPPRVEGCRKRVRAQAPTVHTTLEEGEEAPRGTCVTATDAKKHCGNDPSAVAEKKKKNVSVGESGLEQQTLHDVVDDIAFPVYRCVEGRWTILLKDPVVTVRDEYGTEENIELDFLKVVLDDKFYTSHDS